MTTTVGTALQRAALAIATLLILDAAAFALAQGGKKKQAPAAPPANGGEVEVDLRERGLIFPYGLERFERAEVGTTVQSIEGWSYIDGANPALFDAIVVQDLDIEPRGGSPRNWLQIQDLGDAEDTNGFATRLLVSPDPWDYSWSFFLKIDSLPAPGALHFPKLVVQHDGAAGFQNTWGVELTDNGANLFLTAFGGVADSAPLFPYVHPTALGQWLQVRVVVDLEHNKLQGFVNDELAATLAINPLGSVDLKRQRMIYDGSGPGNTGLMYLDDVNVQFLSGVCKEDILVDFSTEDDEETALVNGQDITTPPEFGNKMTINGSGPNAGAAIFDGTPGGPNDPSQDPDLLVGTGNMLYLQTDANTTQTVAGIFDTPNDDEDGGTLAFTFIRPLQPLSIDLVDIDAASNEGMTITLTDENALTRTYTVPADWTGDTGILTLDLTTLAAQPGFASIATAVEDLGYDGNAVVSMDIVNGGSGAVDNFAACIPCVELTFETEDDGDPLVDGQDISTPPEFGLEVDITSAGPNLGSALFDSTPGGPNDPGPDRDLCVGLGNIMILQNTTAPVQTISGIFDTPNDDQDGGQIFFDFPARVGCHYIDLIDFDEEDVDGITVVLLDDTGDTRTYTVPGGWTEDLLNDGPPGFRRLDLTTLAAQPGFLVSATAVEDPNFDDHDVIQVTLNFGGPGACDNFCFCPQEPAP